MRLLLGPKVLTAVALFGYTSTSTAQQAPAAAPGDSGWTIDKPLTGRAIPCEKGQIAIFECQNVELLAYLPSSTIDGAGTSDIWGWVDSATGREFAIVGSPNGTSFVEVTDPINPQYLGKLPRHTRVRYGIPGIKVYKNHAFIVTEGTEGGMQVFDLARLRDVKNAPVEFQETAHYDRFKSAHTLILNQETGFAYGAGVSGGESCGSGLHMIDVRTPTKPTFAGCYAHATEGGAMGPGYIHDAQCVHYRGPDRDHTGREICLNSSGSSVVIVDVTDKRNPKQIGLATYPNVGYAHQGWFTEDQRYFFLNDEFDEEAMPAAQRRTRTIGFDMSDLDDPVVLTQFYGTTDATDHNLYIRGKYMYQSNYTAGLRIIDISDPKSPKEVGYLDTAPELTGSGMNRGSWGNYPFFKDGVVANADKNGLFLVRLRSR